MAWAIGLLLPSMLARVAWGQAAATGDDPTIDEASGQASEGRSPWSVFPILAYSPETSLMLGAGLVFTFETDPVGGEEARRSSISLASAYTFRNQFFVSIAPSVYFSRETWHLAGELSGSHFPSTFYPVGNETTEEQAERYTDRRFGAAAQLTRRVVESFRVGGQLGLYRSEITDAEADGDLDQDRVAGSDGGWLVGFGPVLEWDNRDNNFATYRGGYYALRAAYFSEAWGSDFGFSKYEIDLRRFFPLGGKHVIATQVYGAANWGRVPFQAMAALGGANRMRGFYEGRFRDLHMVSTLAEYRFPIAGRFGAAVFAGVGEVASELDGFNLEHLRAAGGAGLRFTLNEADRVRLRFDAAGASNGDVNFYVTLGEPF